MIGMSNDQQSIFNNKNLKILVVHENLSSKVSQKFNKKSSIENIFKETSYNKDISYDANLTESDI